MNWLVKTRIPQAWLKNNAVLLTAVRNHWNKDYKPAPYPKTEEERIAAAEKYGLPLSEYKPYKDNGEGCGDYPDLPLESGDSRDPFYPWDNPELKRNFNEPMHTEFDLVREDRYDINAKFRKPMWYMWLQFLGTMTGFYALYFLLENVKMFPAVIPQQFPGQGKKHYTFEECDDQ